MTWCATSRTPDARAEDIFPDGITIPDYFFGRNIVHLPTTQCTSIRRPPAAMKNSVRAAPEHAAALHTLRGFTDARRPLAIQKEIHSGLFAIMDAPPPVTAPGPSHDCTGSEERGCWRPTTRCDVDAVAAKMMGSIPDVDPYINLAPEDSARCRRPHDIEIAATRTRRPRRDFKVGRNLVARRARRLNLVARSKRFRSCVLPARRW